MSGWRWQNFGAGMDLAAGSWVVDGKGRLGTMMTRIPGMMALGVLAFFAWALMGTMPGGSALHLVSPAMAQEGPVIQKIDVQGNQRIEDDTVVSYMTLKQGSTFTPAAADASIKSLFATGLFC